jgi:hypothetical protein
MDFPFFIVYDGKAVGFISYMTDLRCGMNSTAQTRKSFPPGFFFFLRWAVYYLNFLSPLYIQENKKVSLKE